MTEDLIESLAGHLFESQSAGSWPKNAAEDLRARLRGDARAALLWFRQHFGQDLQKGGDHAGGGNPSGMGAVVSHPTVIAAPDLRGLAHTAADELLNPDAHMTDRVEAARPIYLALGLKWPPGCFACGGRGEEGGCDECGEESKTPSVCQHCSDVLIAGRCTRRVYDHTLICDFRRKRGQHCVGGCHYDVGCAGSRLVVR